MDPYPYGDEQMHAHGNDDIINPEAGLWYAVRIGDMEKFKSALKIPGIDIDERCSYKKSTALFEAVSYFANFKSPIVSAEMVDILLRNGANPLARTATRSTPLHSVVAHCSGTKILRNILTHYPDLNVNVRDGRGRTPLLISVFCNIQICIDDVISLLENKANPCIPDLMGDTILHMCSNLSVIDFVLDGSKVAFPIDINIRNKKGQTALYSWIQRSEGVGSGTHASKVASELIKRGADPKISDCNGDTIFHIYPIKLMELVGFDVFHININARNKKGQTALHRAVKRQSYQRVLFLLRLGVDYNIRDFEGETAEDIEFHKHPLANTDILIALSRRREEQNLAIAMASHPRLGAGSRLSNIEPGLLKTISEMARKSST
jgi:ankyrin repeat protein